MLKGIDLKTEYLRNPTAIDELNPRFSWRPEIEIGNRAFSPKFAYQTAYRILVASCDKNCREGRADLWDSGWVKSAATSQIYYRGVPLKPHQDGFWCVCLRDFNGTEGSWSEIATFRKGIETWQGHFIRYERVLDRDNWELCPPLIFGKKVKISEGLKRGTLYITALGVYQVYVNGKEFEETILAPEWTNYWERIQYRALDLTDMLKEGDNDLTIGVANGWYCGVWQNFPPKPYIYGTHPEVCAQLRLEYKDGHVETVATDESWKATEQYRIRFAGIYEGETIDGRIKHPMVEEMELPVNVRWEMPARVVAQTNEPISLLETLSAKEINCPKDGIYVVDFGRNIAGRICLKLRACRGQKIEVFHNEVLTEKGMVYRDNLCAGHFAGPDVDRQIVRYICSGEGVECCRPTFTYMGFRYLEISGLDSLEQLVEAKAQVFCSSIEITGNFTCSDPDINQLQKNIISSSRANFMGVPTDCPQRDERCGYTGDMQFFMPTALHNFDMAAFMKKWLVDVCQDSQLEDGSITDHAPRFARFTNQVGWGDAGIICPYLTYKEYGDKQLIIDHYDAMERYFDFYARNSNEKYIRTDACCGNGDWLHTGPGISDELLTISYFCFHAMMMEEMSAAIGKADRAAYYRDLKEKIKASIVENFVESDGSLKGAGVTGYTLAFTMNLLPDDKQIWEGSARAFTSAIEDSGYRITTGFIGTPRLLIALRNIGRDDLAEKLLMRKECPSWLYPVTVGATTIWERYDGWTEEKGFADSAMNSFNHFAFGSVGDYFYDGILGIRRLDLAVMEKGQENTDYMNYPAVTVNPCYPESITSASGTRRIIGTEVTVSWERKDGHKHLQVEVGPNMTAYVYFAGKSYYCLCGHYDFEEIDIQ